jgi:hypothetical protein
MSTDNGPSKVTRTSEGMRELLFDEIDRLRKGDSDVGTAKAVANLCQTVIKTVEMEMAVATMRRDYPADTKLDLPAPLKLERK